MGAMREWITKEERADFKKYLIDCDISIKQFCVDNKLTYSSFRMVLNGLCPIWKNYGKLIKESIVKRG